MSNTFSRGVGIGCGKEPLLKTFTNYLKFLNCKRIKTRYSLLNLIKKFEIFILQIEELKLEHWQLNTSENEVILFYHSSLKVNHM